MGFSASTTGSSNKSTSSGTQSNTYTPGQTGLMASLGNYFQSLIPSLSSGQLSPAVQAQETQSANTINQNYQSLGQRMQTFLSSRGYGKSGLAGGAQLSTELARQGDLANNTSNYAGLQLGQNAQSLLAALNYAFNPIGQSQSSASSGSGSSTTVGGGVSASLGFG